MKLRYFILALTVYLSIVILDASVLIVGSLT